MIGRGMGARRMADMLHVSPKTIYAYRVRIKDKLQLRDGNELLREAIRWVEKAAEHPVRRHRQADYVSPLGVIGLSERPVTRARALLAGR